MRTDLSVIEVKKTYLEKCVYGVFIGIMTCHVDFNRKVAYVEITHDEVPKGFSYYEDTLSSIRLDRFFDSYMSFMQFLDESQRLLVEHIDSIISNYSANTFLKCFKNESK